MNLHRRILFPATLVVALIFVFACHVRADEPSGREILFEEVLTSDSSVTLVILEGGYLDGLTTGLTADIQARRPDGDSFSFATARVIDVDRYLTWYKIELLPGADPKYLRQVLGMKSRLQLFEADLSPDTLQQMAIAAMGSADYETAAAHLIRLLRAQPELTSAFNALKRCLGTLDEIEQLPLEEDVVAFEENYLLTYIGRMRVYFSAGRVDAARYMSRHIQRIVSGHKLAAAYLRAIAILDSLPKTDAPTTPVRLISTPKRAVFPVSFESDMPESIPLVDVFGMTRFKLDGKRHVKLLRSSGDEKLDEIAEGRAKKALWQNWAERQCIVDFRHADDSIVLVYGAHLDKSESDNSAFLLGSLIQSAENARYLFDPPAVLYAPPVALPDDISKPESLSPVFLNLLIDADGNVEEGMVAKSSGNKTADQAVLDAMSEGIFGSGFPDGTSERFWIGLACLFTVAPDAPVADLPVEGSPSDPETDQFVPTEIFPEMVHEQKPDYPDLAEVMGVTGRVWVKALISEKGRVMEAMVGKSSGNALLDLAAVDAAYGCRYKPGILDGRAVKVWVTYKVDFTM